MNSKKGVEFTARSDSLSYFDKESSQESCAQLLAWFSTSCCQHQFWRLPCWQKKFVAQKLREQKCLSLCLVVITNHQAHFVITFCEKRKVVCENCMGEPHAKVLFVSFFLQSKFVVNTFRHTPFDLEHSINVMKHKLYKWGGGGD